ALEPLHLALDDGGFTQACRLEAARHRRSRPDPPIARSSPRRQPQIVEQPDSDPGIRLMNIRTIRAWASNIEPVAGDFIIRGLYVLKKLLACDCAPVGRGAKTRKDRDIGIRGLCLGNRLSQEL